MVGIVTLTVLAILLALAMGGSLAAWVRFRIHWWPLAVGPLAAQLVLYNPPFDQQPWAIAWGPAIYVLALAAMLAVVARNAIGPASGRMGLRVAMLGVGLNLLVVAVNGGYMPQAPEALLAARGIVRDVAQERGLKLKNTVPLGPDARLTWLADVIPQPAWIPRANVVSIGDLLLSAGFAWWAFEVTASARRRPIAPSGVLGAD
jgi:Family of unknown function (DUF5317)